MLDNKVTQPSKFRTKNWFKTSDDASGTYNTNSQVKLRTIMLKLRFCDYKDTYIHVKGTKTVVGQGADAVAIAAHTNDK